MVGRDKSPMVTTVAPTIPVEAARKAPTTTTDTARPPGSGPKTRAMVVRRSLAIFDRSSVMPISTNISTASNVSIDWPASTRSLIRFTMNDRLRSIACSQPPTNTGSAARGSSGYRKIDIVSALTPWLISSAYMADPVSIAWWIRIPALSSAAMIPKEITPAPPMAKATGKPDRMPPKRQRKTIIRPISTPSSPNSIGSAP